jgi:hypothetical protein
VLLPAGEVADVADALPLPRAYPTNMAFSRNPVRCAVSEREVSRYSYGSLFSIPDQLSCPYLVILSQTAVFEASSQHHGSATACSRTFRLTEKWCRSRVSDSSRAFIGNAEPLQCWRGL